MAAEQRSERQAAELQRQAEVSEQQAAELQSKLQSMQSMRRQISQNEVALQQAKATTHQVTHGEGKEGGEGGGPREAGTSVRSKVRPH